jgi:Flp pilus assembly protein TadD
MTPPTPWLRRAAPIVVVLVGAAVYARSLRGEFVFDDTAQLRDNPLLRDVGNYLPGGAGYRAMPNRFVAYVTFALNYRLGGPSTLGFHLFNVAVHVANGLLVLALVRLAFQAPVLRRSELARSAPAIGLAAAALFVVHPLQTQAVAYLVQRLTSLATFFYLAAVVLYVAWRISPEGRATRVRRLACYAGAIVTTLLAMRTKEIAFTLPLALVLVEVCFLEGPRWRRLRDLVPFLATLAIIPLSLLRLDRPAGQVLSDVSEATRLDTNLPRLDYVTTELAVIARYVRLLLVPVGQNADYDFPIYRSLLHAPVLAGAALVVSSAAGAVLLYVRTRRPAAEGGLDPGARLAGFGLAWFLLGLAVESSVIPIVDVIFEHRVYLPSVGAFVAAATGAAFLARRLSPARADAALLAGVAAVALVLGPLTIRRNEVWTSRLALWSDVVERSPAKRRAHYNLANALGDANRTAAAIEHYEAALRIDPTYSPAYNNLAAALMQQGRRAEATAVLRSAILVDPKNAAPLYNLASMQLEDPAYAAEAIDLLRKAIELQPGFGAAYMNLSVAYNRQRRFAETIRLVEGADAVAAQFPALRFNLGIAYVGAGDPKAAARQASLLQAQDPALASGLRQRIAAAQGGASPR